MIVQHTPKLMCCPMGRWLKKSSQPSPFFALVRAQEQRQRGGRGCEQSEPDGSSLLECFVLQAGEFQAQDQARLGGEKSAPGGVARGVAELFGEGCKAQPKLDARAQN